MKRGGKVWSRRRECSSCESEKSARPITFRRQIWPTYCGGLLMISRGNNLRRASLPILAAAAAFAFVLAILASPARPDPVPPGALHVVDGDTIEARGRIVRLVGFDTPERDGRCPAERNLAARATMRLRQLIAGGGLDLRIVRCSCRPGTEGTRRCNYGRSCGALIVRGRDVGSVLISEGLARRYVCGATSCPRRASWC